MLSWLCRIHSIILVLFLLRGHTCQPTTDAESGPLCLGPDCIKYTVNSADQDCRVSKDLSPTLKEIQEQLRCLRQDCPHSYVRLNCSCYKVVNKSATWHDAQWDCSIMGAHLIEITSQQEQDFIGRQVAALYYDGGGFVTLYGFWIGGYENLPEQDSSSTATGTSTNGTTTVLPPIEGEWKWNSSGQPFTYTNWNADEPNNWGGQGEDCLMMTFSRGYKWNDAMCGDRHTFICELELL